MDKNVYLKPSYFLDFKTKSVQDYLARFCSKNLSAEENIIRLFYHIRDGFRYNPYDVQNKKEYFKASEVANRTFERGGHCIDKATLLAACARALEIPSRLHFVNVRNHIGTQKLEKVLGSNVLVFHGYTEVFIKEQWVAATPAFNMELCERLGVRPLEFDGQADAVFQEYDKQGGLFMEYIHDYGTFDDIPFEVMVAEWEKYYPGYLARLQSLSIQP